MTFRIRFIYNIFICLIIPVPAASVIPARRPCGELPRACPSEGAGTVHPEDGPEKL